MTQLDQSGEFATASHEERKQQTQTALVALTKKDVERRVSSSSFSSRVYVTDSCWVPTAGSATTFMLCGLSNDCICLLNINNLSKIYLFEEKHVDEVATGTAKDGNHRESSRRRLVLHRQVSVDCSPRLVAGGAKVSMGMVLDGAVRSCVLDTTSATELKKLQNGSGDKILDLPNAVDVVNVSEGLTPVLTDTLLRFSPSGTHAFALLMYEISKEGGLEVVSRPVTYTYRITVFSLSRSTATEPDRWAPAQTHWSTRVRRYGSEEDDDICGGAGACLRYFGWWDDQSLLAVWSDGAVQLYEIGADGSPTLVSEEAIFLGESRASGTQEHHVRAAAATAALPSASLGKGNDTAQLGVLAVTVGTNCVSSFNICVGSGIAKAQVGLPGSNGSEQPAQKRARGEGAGGTSRRVLSLHPTQQSYFSEDIPVRTLTLTFLYSWVVTLVLESGAVVFLDTQTMALLHHRSLKRLLSEDDEAVDYVAGPLRPNAKRLRCVTSDRPVNIGLVEHNTVAIFKPL